MRTSRAVVARLHSHRAAQRSHGTRFAVEQLIIFNGWFAALAERVENFANKITRDLPLQELRPPNLCQMAACGQVAVAFP